MWNAEDDEDQDGAFRQPGILGILGLKMVQVSRKDAVTLQFCQRHRARCRLHGHAPGAHGSDCDSAREVLLLVMSHA